MQKLLSEVEQGVWAGVLVMEVERLARGDTIDLHITTTNTSRPDTEYQTAIATV